MNTIYVIAQIVPKHRCYLIFHEIVRIHIENPQVHIRLCQPKHVSDEFLYSNKMSWLSRQTNIPKCIPLCTLVVRFNGTFPTLHKSQKILDLMIFDLYNQSITWAVTPEVEPYVSEILDMCMTSSSKKIVYKSEDELLNVSTEVLVMVQTPPMQRVYKLLVDKVDIWTLNTEMMTRETFPSFVSFRKAALEHNLKVLDYSHANISIGSSFIPRVTSAILRLPYSVVPPENTTVNAVGFIGTMSPRRFHIVTSLLSKNVKVLVCPQLFKSNELKDFRSKCRIIVNVHFEKEHTIFETFRCIPAVLDGCIVVSETSVFEDQYMYPDAISRIVFCKYSDIVQKITSLVETTEVLN